MSKSDDTISRQAAIDALFKKFDADTGVTWIPLEHIEQLPSAQPELIEKAAYIRGFEHGRTQGMIDAQERKK